MALQRAEAGTKAAVLIQVASSALYLNLALDFEIDGQILFT